MLTLEQVRQFLYYEARLLDDRQWDEWLNCYSPKVVFWMPAWGDDDKLTRDPQKEISLIYYPNRDGLEDRVYRIKTERSGASTPEPRTTHMISNVELLGTPGEDSLQAAAHPAKTPYLYFVADGKGGHTFNTNLASHNRSVQDYLKVLKEKNAQ